MRALAAVKATAVGISRYISPCPSWAPAPHSAFARSSSTNRSSQWAGQCPVWKSADPRCCSSQIPHRRRNHSSYPYLSRCRSDQPSVTDAASPAVDAITVLSSSAVTSTNTTRPAVAVTRCHHTSTTDYSIRRISNYTTSASGRTAIIRTTRTASARSYAKAFSTQHHRNNNTPLEHPVTMIESSLGSTRAVFDQLFRRRSSRFRECRSSSWHSKSGNSNAKRQNSTTAAGVHNATTPLPIITSGSVPTKEPNLQPQPVRAEQVYQSHRQQQDEPAQPKSSSKYTFKSHIPAQAWDSHMHVLDPRFQHTLAPTAKYTPSLTAPTRVSHMETFERDIAGLYGVVLVQPSIYGHDNSCLLDALHQLGPAKARGVVAFEDPALWANSLASSTTSSSEDEGIELPPSPPSSSPSTTASEIGDKDNDIPSGTEMSHAALQRWHNLGVRGVRINLQSHGDTSPLTPAALQALVRRYIDVVRPLGGWVVQLYVGMDMLHILEPIVQEDLGGVKLCIDHMGHPHIARLQKYKETQDPYDIPGFDVLVRLLATGRVWVKISAAYRFSEETFASADGKDHKALGEDSALSRDVHPIARELLKVAGLTSCVFATDWPHTRFDGLDIQPWMQSVFDLCGEVGGEELVERVFRGNAEALWDIRRSKVEDK